MKANRLQLLLGIEGLALLRLWLTGEQEEIDARIDDIDRLVRMREDPELGGFSELPETEVREGYDAKADTYDDAPNPIVALETPAVRPLLDDLAPSTVLDAACGTGRHAEYLADRGHRTTAVDAAPAMVERARAKLPGTEVLSGDLEALPLDDESVDHAVCSLALTHLPELTTGVRELARVVRPGGRVILSDVHPVFVALGGQAYFTTTEGGRGFIRNHVHSHSSYLAAFAGAGLRLRGCWEPTFDRDAVELLRPSRLLPEAVAGGMLGLPAVLVWELERASSTEPATGPAPAG